MLKRNLSVLFFAALALSSALGARTLPVATGGTPAEAGATAWQIDPVHSSIVWIVSHNNGAGKVYGRFNSFSGTIVADAAHPENSSVEVSVDAATVDTAVAKRDDHLRTADFFNVEQFPTLTFTSTAVHPVPGKANTYTVDGDLTMLGVSKPQSIVITQLASTQGKDGTPITGFESSFTVKRSDWGMAFGIPGLSDEIEVMLAFECKGPAPAQAAATATKG
jgi:polyisoprenoid-binding protein YceI